MAGQFHTTNFRSVFKEQYSTIYHIFIYYLSKCLRQSSAIDWVVFESAKMLKKFDIRREPKGSQREPQRNKGCQKGAKDQENH